MLRTIVIVTCILTGFWCLLALADGQNWTQPAWEQLLPQAVLPRRLSPTEAQAARIESRIAEVKGEIGTTMEKRNEISRRRLELLGKLREQVVEARTDEQGSYADPTETAEGESHLPSPQTDGATGEKTSSDIRKLLEDHVIVSALVRSIDAENRRDTELAARQAERKTELERLQGRLIALQSGTVLADADEPVRPSDGLRPEGANPASERYEHILREAMRCTD